MKKSFLLFILVPFSVIFLTCGCSQQDKKRTEQVDLTLLLDWKMVSFYAPYLLADEKGFYAEEGIKIKIEEGQGAETSAKLIGQGRYKIGTSNAAATAIAVDNGVPVISIAVVEQDAVTAIFSLATSGITAPTDLLGKTLGVRYYDISHKEYLSMMKAQNLDPTKVKEVNVGWELQPLLTGQVDALYNYSYNMPVVLEVQGHKVNKIQVKDFGVLGYGSNIIANTEYANANPQVVEGFLRASRKAWEATMKNPEETIQVLKRRYPETDEKLALATLKEQLRWIVSGRENIELFVQSAQRWEQILKNYESVGMIKNKISVDSVFTNKFLQ